MKSKNYLKPVSNFFNKKITFYNNSKKAIQIEVWKLFLIFLFLPLLVPVILLLKIIKFQRYLNTPLNGK